MSSTTASIRTVRLLGAAIAVVLLAGLVGAATYEEDEVETSAKGEGTTTTTTTEGGDGGGDVGDDGDGEAPESVPETSPDDGGTTATTAGTGGAATTQAPATTVAPQNRPFGTSPTTPGTYTYDVTGTIDGEPVDDTATLTVPEPDAQGRQAQVQKGPDGTTTTTYRVTAEGTYLEKLDIRSEQGSFTMEATAPFLIIPADMAPGAVTKGTLAGDGLQAKITFTLNERDATRAVADLVADISGKFQGFDVDGRTESDITARATDLLSTKTRSKSELNAGNGLFTSSSDITAVLRQ